MMYVYSVCNHNTTMNFMQTIQGIEVQKNLTVMNVQAATEEFKSELKDHGARNPRGERKELFPGCQISTNRDYSLRRGDPMTRKRERPLNFLEQQPHVRSCMNNLRVLMPKNDATHEERVRRFWKENVYLGVSRKDTVIDMESKSSNVLLKDDAVAVLDGKFTIPALGSAPLKVRDIIEVYVPDVKARLNTTPAYNENGTLKTTRSRIPVTYRPFNASCDIFNEINESNLLKLAIKELLNSYSIKENELEHDTQELVDKMNLVMNYGSKSLVYAWSTVPIVMQMSVPSGMYGDGMVHPFGIAVLDLKPVVTKSVQPTIPSLKPVNTNTQNPAGVNYSLFAKDVLEFFGDTNALHKATLIAPTLSKVSPPDAPEMTIINTLIEYEENFKKVGTMNNSIDWETFWVRVHEIRNSDDL